MHCDYLRDRGGVLCSTILHGSGHGSPKARMMSPWVNEVEAETILFDKYRYEKKPCS